MWYKIVLFLIQFSAIIFGIYYWKDYCKTKQKYFLFLIIFAVLVDLFSGFISANTGQRFSFLYNVLTIVSFLFYFYWFYYLLKKSKIVYVFLAVFVLTIIYSIFNYNIINQFYNWLLMVGTVLILICSVCYFMIIIKTDIVIEYKRSQRFWIVAGLLVFHIGYLPMHMLLMFIKVNTLVYKMPMLILNILLYGCYIISFKVAKYKIDD